MKKFIGFCLSFLLLVAIFNGVNVGYVNAYSEPFPDFTSDSYILLEPNTDSVLLAKNSEEKMPVASICKLMTSLLTLEKIDSGALKLTDNIIASEHACSMEGSQAFLDAGSNYSVSDLLKSVVVASANDSAVVLAEAISGSENAFVLEMNKRAKELGMNNTVYANATGLPAPNQYSTAIDTAKLLKEVSKHELYVNNSNIWLDTMQHPSGRQTELVNTNRLIKYYSNCKTGKTGFTDEAGYCLASMAQNNNFNLIVVVLKCDKPQDRFKESIDLYNYGFANFENKKLIDSNMELDKKVRVLGGKAESVKCKYKTDFSVVTRKGDAKNYEVIVNLVDSVNAPKMAGEVVGKASVVKEGRVVGEVDVVLSDNLEKQTFADIVNKIANNWSLK